MAEHDENLINNSVNGENRRKIPHLETIRVLHKAVKSLRTALEQSRREINNLKAAKSKESVRVNPSPSLLLTSSTALTTSSSASSSVINTLIIDDEIAALNRENHQLRKQLLNVREKNKTIKTINNINNNNRHNININNKSQHNTNKASSSIESETKMSTNKQQNNEDRTTTIPSININNNTNIEHHLHDHQEADDDVNSINVTAAAKEDDQDLEGECNDIDLIFTTEDTNNSKTFEDLVSIESTTNTSEGTTVINNENPTLIPNPLTHHHHHQHHHHQPFLLMVEADGNSQEAVDDDDDDEEEEEEEEDDDDVFHNENTTAIDDNGHHQSSTLWSLGHLNSNTSTHSSDSLVQATVFTNTSSLDRDESFDRFEYPLLETDISKCGINDLMHTSTASANSRRFTCPSIRRPQRFINTTNTINANRQLTKTPPGGGSGATRDLYQDRSSQTDISASGANTNIWVSETNLSSAQPHTDINRKLLLTLPSKILAPFGSGGGGGGGGGVGRNHRIKSKLNLSEKSSVEARRVLLSDLRFTSMVPELSRSADHIGRIAEEDAITTPGGQYLRVASFTKTTVPTTSKHQPLQPRKSTPLDGINSNAPINYRWSRRVSAPVSPTLTTVSASAIGGKRSINPSTSTSQFRVRFANINGSLPELRRDLSNSMGRTDSSEDSNESIVQEPIGGPFLRRSVECICSCSGNKRSEEERRRRASAPEPVADNIPPAGWCPFLPRTAHDLRLDHWVKVITNEGRVRGGRVRYIGPVEPITRTTTTCDIMIGVQLATPNGQSDGVFNNRRYFHCELFHGIFVTFQKIIMGWRP